jgi:hypothetical protein
MTGERRVTGPQWSVGKLNEESASVEALADPLWRFPSERLRLPASRLGTSTRRHFPWGTNPSLVRVILGREHARFEPPSAQSAEIRFGTFASLAINEPHGWLTATTAAPESARAGREHPISPAHTASASAAAGHCRRTTRPPNIKPVNRNSDLKPSSDRAAR